MSAALLIAGAIVATVLSSVALVFAAAFIGEQLGERPAVRRGRR